MRITSFLPPTLWAILILGLSTSSSVSLPETFWDILALDKLAHAIVYGILNLLVFHAFFKEKKLTNKTKVLSILFCSLFGVLMEFIQYTFFPNRYFEVLDIFANIIGIFGSLYIFPFFLIFLE